MKKDLFQKDAKKKNVNDLPVIEQDHIECPWVPVNEPPFTTPVFPDPCKPSESEPDWTYVRK